MRPLIALSLLTLALLSLTSVVAVQSLSSTNQSALTIVSTSDALLALAPGLGAGNASGTAFYQNPVSQDVLLLDFRKGWDAGSYGFTANVTAYANLFRYRWLFTVTNQSAYTQCVSVYVPGVGPADLASIRVRAPGEAGSGLQVAGAGGGSPSCQNLAAGQSFEVDLWWSVTSTAPHTGSFMLRVESIRA